MKSATTKKLGGIEHKFTTILTKLTQVGSIAKETGNQNLIGLFLSNFKKFEFTFSFRNKNYYLNNKNYPSIAFCQILSFVHKKHIRKYIFKFLDYGHSTTVQYIQSLQCEFYKSKYEYRKFRETFRIVLFFI